MASLQMRKEDEEHADVEKDRVQKITTHYESITDKAKHDQDTAISPSKKNNAPKEDDLAETQTLRATAQQNSIDAINSAEERYEIAPKVKDAAEYITTAKDAAVDYVSEKTEATAERGKGAVDQAAVAGWGAVQYTMEKVAGATKTTADVLSSAGHTVAEKLTAAKDAVVASEEKAAQYAARKKAEAGKDLEASLQRQIEIGGEEEGGGILQAIGETLVEIGQTTKEVTVGAGQYPHHQAAVDHPQEEEEKRAEIEHLNEAN